LLAPTALAKAACKKVIEDKVSGTRADRPGLANTLEMLREGDTLVVWKLDRLGRSVKQLVDLVGELHKQGVQFDRQQDRVGQEVAGQRRAAQGRGPEPWRVYSDALPLGASLLA
jgi:DNA invertase Pin-like site-specific DNA recombinase